MYFQLEVDYYSNEANKNKYTNFQLIASIKKQPKDSWGSDCTGHCTCNDNLSYFVAWTCCCLKVYFSSASSFEQDISRSMFISIRCTNTAVHKAGPQGYPLLSTNVGVSPLHGLIVASLRINQIYIKIDKVQVKPYLHQNHSIG